MSAEPKKTQVMDEAQPTSGTAPTPIALVVVFAALVYWGMLYLDDHGGGFNPKVYAPYANLAMVTEKQPVLDLQTKMIQDGHRIFDANCAACHGPTGTGLSCPPLANSDWVNAAGPDRIARLVMNGGGGPITVSGKQITPAATMLSFKDTLKDDYQVAAVLTYVRNSFGNNASMVSKEQVAKIRAVVASRRIPWTERELLAIPITTEVVEKK